VIIKTSREKAGCFLQIIMLFITQETIPVFFGKTRKITVLKIIVGVHE